MKRIALVPLALLLAAATIGRAGDATRHTEPASGSGTGDPAAAAAAAPAGSDAVAD